MTTDVEPLSLARTMREHHTWCATNNVPFDSDESKERLLGSLPADAADYVRHRAIEEGVRAAFNAVRAAGLGAWKNGEVFHVPEPNKAAAKPIFSEAFDRYMQGDQD
jgi:hypothetical protein